ncbi:antibiotic biosynthesis monooxygenase [Novosphingobium sp. AAP83]|uniref:putative quinol monooxygenase n=1 Tax=Novosphingobium sp. AAP83 TaxID=1523425 RepID=UPI0006B8F7A7|nr:putative quinol monooxygenase [Novosphingobium sp. AAP83]KPF92031.1 antibiotic biosynthesis monooxygenase [Novosphingobium sp. AAP83]
MIGIVMHVRTKPDKSNEFAQLMTQLQQDVRAGEPDVLVYQVMRSDDDPSVFLITEVFANEAAYLAHPEMPYHKAMSAAGWACVEGEPVITRCKPLTDTSTGGGMAL